LEAVSTRLRKALDFYSSDDCRDLLGYAFVAVFFFYLIVFVWVAPSPALTGAVAFEIVLYLSFLAYRLKRKKAKSVHARQAIVSTMVYFLPFGAVIARFSKHIKAFIALAAGAVLALAIFDVAAFGLASAGQYKAATFIYSRFPVSQLAGFHPAHTMELLCGANVKAGKLAQVEPLYNSLLEIRKNFYGANHERICDLYADLGDLYERRNQFSQAEHYYVSAIAMSNEIKVPKGCGKYLTRLGELKAKQGKFKDALATLEKAREMRARYYGSQSQKVADTLAATARVYQSMGLRDQAQTVAHQALLIYRSLPKNDHNPAYYSALFSLFLMAAVFFSTRKSGWMTGLAVAKLETLIAGDGISQSEKMHLKERLELLMQYTRTGNKTGAAKKSDRQEPDEECEVTGQCCLILSLASQDLR